MSGTKFMVIKFKELLKTAIFAVLGVIIIIGLIYFFLPKTDRNAKYEPGVYTSEFALNGETAEIQVTVDSKKIKSVELKNSSEAMPIFYPLVETTAKTLGTEIVKNQSLHVKVSPHNPYTSELILGAVEHGLAQAAVN